ncbi:MAG: ribosome small subunit-dependent GTPase A [Deltaproteobacteria bacterium]|nr:ribosome small subunit-dependent GTPase A [Deltaproteobacteria bacterium]
MEDLREGIVLKRIKGFYYLMDDFGEEVACKIKGSLFKESRFDNQVAVGDRVRYLLSEKNTQGLITGLLPRRSFLSRNRVGIDTEQIIAANVDLLLMVSSVKQPAFRHNLIFRLIVAAYIGNIIPVLVMTKTDLLGIKEIRELLRPFEGIDISIQLTSVKQPKTCLEIKDLIASRICVLSGHSGVGKSTLVNLLYPEFQLETGKINPKTSKGLHTTTSSMMYPVGEKGFIIDTPGIREFGFWNLKRENLRKYYPGIRDYNSQCKLRNCCHIHEPSCQVKSDLKEKNLNSDLYAGYISIYESLPSGGH